MINIDVSVVIQIINFIFLIWVLNVILYKPIRSMLLQRKEKVTGMEQGIAKFQQDAVAQEDAFASGIRSARAEGMKKKEALLEAAAAEERKIIGKINEKAQADLAEVREKIAKDAEGVRITLQKEVDVFADAIGQKILGRAV